MTKRVVRRILEFKALILLIFLGLSNLAVYDEVGGPIQECCEILESVISFDPDPVKICEGRSGETVAHLGESANWKFASAPTPRFFSNRSIQPGPGSSSRITHQTVNQFDFAEDSKTVRVRVMATPPEKEPSSGWFSILLRPLSITAPGATVSHTSSEISMRGNRMEIQFQVFCGLDFAEPEEGPWTFSITPGKTWVERSSFGSYGSHSTNPVRVFINPSDGNAVVQQVTQVHDGCASGSCGAFTYYTVKAQSQDPARTVTRQMSVYTRVRSPSSEARLTSPFPNKTS